MSLFFATMYQLFKVNTEHPLYQISPKNQSKKKVSSFEKLATLNNTHKSAALQTFHSWEF